MENEVNNLFTIWVDADGCPVVEATINIAQKNFISIVIVKNYSINIKNDYAKIVTVDISKDSADYYIANHMKQDDLVITQDNGLAAMVLAKKGYCLNQNGKEITPSNIDFILDSRYQNSLSIMRGNKGHKHKKRTQDDDRDYEEALINFINRISL